MSSVTNNFQPSIAEWFKAIGKTEDADLIRNEDNSRTDRLILLGKLIDIDADAPEIFAATELVEQSDRFKQHFEAFANQPSAIRLVPQKEGLPKLRDRGQTLRRCYEDWFKGQVFDPTDYRAEVYRHTDTQRWGMTFIVNAQGVFGEIIKGLHTQLNHGETQSRQIAFSYDFETWSWSEESPAAEVITTILDGLTVEDQQEQERISEALGVPFYHNILSGYFEAILDDADGRTIIIDYNRILGRYSAPPTVTRNSGSIAFPGVVTGRAVVVEAHDVASVAFSPGDILVTDNTDVRFLPLMKIAGAIVTNRGGILSHAAIVARELKKPCLIGTKNATELFKTGDMILVDADHGTICKIERIED